MVDCGFDRNRLNVDTLTAADALPFAEDLEPVYPVGVYGSVDVCVPVTRSAGDFDYVCTAENAVFPELGLPELAKGCHDMLDHYRQVGFRSDRQSEVFDAGSSSVLDVR